MTLLKQVAAMRDNTFQLHRYLWNDVQEDWPFYSEQERTTMRRRKPQNLTPPGSSDGSTGMYFILSCHLCYFFSFVQTIILFRLLLVGSGQSPNSIQSGSPPAIAAPPPNIFAKRPGYYQGTDGLPTKKPRISHYRKSEANPCSSNASDSGRMMTSVSSNILNVGSNNASGSGGNSSGSNSVVSSWDQRQQQQQQQRERRVELRLDKNCDVMRDLYDGVSAYCSKPVSIPTDTTSNHNQSWCGRNGGGVAAVSGNAGISSSIAMPGSHNPHSSPAYNNNNPMNSGGNDRHYHAGRSATVVSGDSSACGAGIDNAARFSSTDARSGSGINTSFSINSGTGGGVSGSSNHSDRRNKSDRNRTGAREERDWEFLARSGMSSYDDNNAASASNRDLPIIMQSPESPPTSDQGLLPLGHPVALLDNQVPDYVT